MEHHDTLAFADQTSRFFNQRYGMPPVAGRVVGWLLACDPPAQTPAQLAEALGASRSSIGSAIELLERNSIVERARPAGHRADLIRIDPGGGAADLDDTQQYQDQAALAHRGLALLADAPRERRARLLEYVAFAEFLTKRLPDLAEEWRAHRDALRASGDLPTPD